MDRSICNFQMDVMAPSETNAVPQVFHITLQFTQAILNSFSRKRIMKGPIDHTNNGSRPKSTESDVDQGFLRSPSADLIFLLDARGLCIATGISAAKTAPAPDWPKRQRAGPGHLIS